MKGLLTLIGGAAIGAVATALFTTPQGEELRYRIKLYLQKKGIIPASRLDDFVELIASEIEEKK